MTQKLNRGEIWLADLNPRPGTEPGKVRPILIIQSQVLLDVEHPSIIIVPLTTNLIDAAWPLRIRIRPKGKLQKPSDLLLDQVRAIDKARLVEGPLLQCGPNFMSEVMAALFEVMGS